MPPQGLPWRNVSWKVLEECNYRCAYCLQPSYSYFYPQNLDIIVDCIDRNLGEKYEVKIAGGEVFYDTGIAVRLAKSLVSREHWISICTNLSARVEDYYAFLEATGGKFYTFGASLHLEYVDPYEFLQKCIKIRSELPLYSKIQVHNVITHGIDAIRLLGEIKKNFESEGFIFYTDLLVDEKGKYMEYSQEEEKNIAECLGADNKLVRHSGQPCRAGDTYFALLPNMDAWACWDAYLSDERSMYLGNMIEGTFKLPKHITNCPFDTCSCPTPILKHTYKLKAKKIHG